MPERIAADAVVMLHLAFVAFVVLGGFLVLRLPKLAWLHLPALSWGVWIEVSGGICPLTPLENALRRRAGEAGYESGFIEHYLHPLLYPPGLTRGAQLALAVAILMLNGAIYALLYLRARRRSNASR